MNQLYLCLTAMLCFLPIFKTPERGTFPFVPEDDCSKTYDILLNQYVYSFVDEPPQFPGSDGALPRFIVKHLRYPKNAMDGYWQSHLSLSFVIDTSGRLQEPRIGDKNAAQYTALDQEGMRLMAIMPAWKPGKCHGRKVPVRLLIPVTVCLQD